MAKRGRTTGPIPDKATILAFIQENPSPITKRDLRRRFPISRDHRRAFEQILTELQAEGLVAGGRRGDRRFRLPKVAVLEITEIDIDGEVRAIPANWDRDAVPPVIYVTAADRGAPGTGDRVLARLRPLDDGTYEAAVMRRIEPRPARILGVYTVSPECGRVRPVERQRRIEYAVPEDESLGATSRELVLVEPIRGGRRFGLPRARVLDRLATIDDAQSISLISIHAHNIPTAFEPDAISLANAARPAPTEGRTDLRELPLVTIDEPDARDFDDAVWAEAQSHDGGWHLIVAIADVAWYVRSGDALDRCAAMRGNSVYFPGRVVPMLPEPLSNELCSLKPGEDRACIAAHIWLDDVGNIRRCYFQRTVIRSAARLTYAQVQAVRDGEAGAGVPRSITKMIKALYGAYESLATARARRGTLELELPEQRVAFGPDGEIARIASRPRLDSHKLIEEFMIAANVAAADSLTRRRQPCMHRVHDAPDPARVDSVADLLSDLGFRLSKRQAITPAQFNRILAKARNTPYEALISQLILRAQAQAAYDPENIGHFGLGLRRYCHFTSPIRRYADILVHRAIITAYDLGEGGLPEDAAASFTELGERISAAERRALAAERDAVGRYAAAYLASSTDASFSGRIGGVTTAGLFVTLDETGADGFVPVSSLPADRYTHVQRGHHLVGRDTGRTYRLGDTVEARLVEADPMSGRILCHLLDGPGGIDGAASAARSRKNVGRSRKPRGRPTKGQVPSIRAR